MQKEVIKHEDTITINFLGEDRKVPVNLPLLAIASQYTEELQPPLVAAKYNNQLVDLYTEVTQPGIIEFINLSTEDGLKVYRQSLVFLLARAVYELYPHYKIVVEHSLGNSYYCRIKGQDSISILELAALEAKMKELSDKNEPISPQVLSKERAIQKITAMGSLETASLIEKMAWERVILYNSGSYSHYSYSVLAPSTGCLKTFQIQQYAKGFLLCFPSAEKSNTVATCPNLPKLGQIFRESEEWADILGISNLAALQRLLNKNPEEGTSLIHVAEALQEKRIAQIADEIYEERSRLRLILIAGPSSSGKTTFAQRLAIQLRVLGLRPISISMDNYFVDRESTPRDQKGDYDFEALEAVDLKLFNEHLSQLIDCQEVECPIFNFHRGAREDKGRPVRVDQDHPIIIEGIHGLNEKLTASIKRENKYKIYISALTQISIDNYNRIPTTDTRLIRRLVRDYKYRSQEALSTLKRWPSVRRGEERNIFPYQEDADVMFNSALIYELAILKKYALPLLNNVGKEVVQYSDAQRLLAILKHFPDLSDKYVPLNSILREFIGGSSIHGE